MKFNRHIASVVVLVQVLAVSAMGASAKTVLRLATWDGGDGLKAIQNAVNQFSKEFPDIQVKVESLGWDGYTSKLLVQLAAGSPPDVFMMPDYEVAVYALTGLVQPLSQFITQSKMDLTDLKKSILKQYTFVDGKIYALPKDYSATAAVINKTLLANAGLVFPSNSWTWDDALLYGKKLTRADASGKIEQNGLQMDPTGLSAYYMLHTFGSAFMGGKGSFAGYADSGASLRALQTAVDIRTRYKLMDTWKDFTLGKVGISIEANFTGIASYRRKKGLDYWTQVPPIKDQAGSAVCTSAWAMPTVTKKAKQAWELVRFLGGPKGHKVMAQAAWALPAWKSVVAEIGLSKTDFGAFDEAAEQAALSAPPAYPFMGPLVDKYLAPATVKAFNGKADLALVLAAAIPTAQKDYDRQMQRLTGKAKKK